MDIEVYKQMMAELEGLADISKEPLQELQQKITKSEYPEYIKSFGLKMIQDRAFELDILELTELGNEFDSMDANAILETMAKVPQTQASPYCQKIYSDKLRERALNIAMSDAYPYSLFYMQLAAKYNFPVGNMMFANFDNNYFANLEYFKKDFNVVEDVFEIPIILSSGKPYIAISKKRCYIKTEAGNFAYNLEDIYSFSTAKGKHYEMLSICLKSGEMLYLPGIVLKNTLISMVSLLNEFVYTVVNNIDLGPVNSFQAPRAVTNFDLAAFAVKGRQYNYSYDFIIAKTVSAYKQRNDVLGNAASIFCKGDKKWEDMERKIITNYGMIYESPIVLCHDKSLTRSGKEGFALSQTTFYIKKNNQGLISIPFSMIASVDLTFQRNTLQITTVDNYAFVLDTLIMDEYKLGIIKEILENYMKGCNLTSAINLENQQNNVN